ncbi:MAG TPA: PIN domain-containing protein, partial [bacterium]|nr:PIN domain-containing protein [bacterium]
MKKTFVLDTNVILHDSGCIFFFQENDIVIPITVIEEIDAFKRGQDLINFHAREFVRLLDTFPGDALVKGGVSLGEGRGRISILTLFDEEPEIHRAFLE